eukprot:2611916-Rhodomonas_salina.1
MTYIRVPDGIRRGCYIDGTPPAVRGLASYVNHSCAPNTEIQKRFVRGHIRLCLVSLSKIQAQSEITCSYQWDSAGGNQQPCRCGSGAACSGILWLPARLNPSQIRAWCQADPSLDPNLAAHLSPDEMDTWDEPGDTLYRVHSRDRAAEAAGAAGAVTRSSARGDGSARS